MRYPPPDHFSQIANWHANHFPSHPNWHSIPWKPFTNRCQTISGIQNLGQYDCCVSTLPPAHHKCVSTSFRFRVGRLEFNQSPEQRNRLQLLSQQRRRRRRQPELRRLSSGIGKPLRLLRSTHHHFGREISHEGPGLWGCQRRSLKVLLEVQADWQGSLDFSIRLQHEGVWRNITTHLVVYRSNRTRRGPTPPAAGRYPTGPVVTLVPATGGHTTTAQHTSIQSARSMKTACMQTICACASGSPRHPRPLSRRRPWPPPPRLCSREMHDETRRRSRPSCGPALGKSSLPPTLPQFLRLSSLGLFATLDMSSLRREQR